MGRRLNLRRGLGLGRGWVWGEPRYGRGASWEEEELGMGKGLVGLD